MRRLVQRAKHFFAERSGHGNAGGDGTLVAMLEERVFDYKLGPDVSICFHGRIRFKLVYVGARVSVQKMDYSCNCWVSALLRSSLCARGSDQLLRQDTRIMGRLLRAQRGTSASIDTESKRDSASAIAFSQPRTYTICIGYSIIVASHPEILADSLGSFEKSHWSARLSVLKRNGRASR